MALGGPREFQSALVQPRLVQELGLAEWCSGSCSRHQARLSVLPGAWACLSGGQPAALPVPRWAGHRGGMNPFACLTSSVYTCTPHQRKYHFSSDLHRQDSCLCCDHLVTVPRSWGHGSGIPWQEWCTFPLGAHGLIPGPWMTSGLLILLTGTIFTLVLVFVPGHFGYRALGSAALPTIPRELPALLA